jgi:hypothetical protein
VLSLHGMSLELPELRVYGDPEWSPFFGWLGYGSGMTTGITFRP